MQTCSLAGGGAVTIRPIKPDDASMLQTFVRRLSTRSRYLRFFASVSELSASQLERFVSVDRRHGMALVALSNEGKSAAIVAEARCLLDHDTNTAEFAIVVADEFRRRGLGTQLMNSLLAYAASTRVRRMFAEIMADNSVMLAFARRLGFHLTVNVADRTTMIASISRSF